MGVSILLLLPEVVGEAGESDGPDPAADGIGLIFGSHRGYDHGFPGEGLAECCCFETGGAGKASRLNYGAIGQGGPSFFQNQVVDGFRDMRAVEVIPFGQPDIKSRLGYIAKPYDTRVAAIVTRRACNHDGIFEG